jgi:hypothetical protein
MKHLWQVFSKISIEQMKGLLRNFNNGDDCFFRLDSDNHSLLNNFRHASESESSCINRILHSALTLLPSSANQILSREKESLEAEQRREDGCE